MRTHRPCTLYLNGTAIKTNTIKVPVWNAESSMSLGARMLGDLDDEQIYQQALNTDDMARLGTQNPPALRSPTSQPTPTAKGALADAVFDVKYDHISLEDCIEAQRQAGADPDQDILRSSLVVRPYSTCWSKYIYISEFHKGKKTGKLVGYGSAVQLKATWVTHSYLGTADGSRVVGDTGGTLKPQQIKYFTRLSEIKTFGVLGVKYTSLEARVETTGLYDNQRLRLELNPVGEDGSTCRLARGADREATLGQWTSDGNDDFVLQMTDTDGDKVDTCTVRPTLQDANDRWTDEPVYLYDQIVFDEQGSILGRRIGGGEPWSTVYAPHFRCDWLRSSASRRPQRAYRCRPMTICQTSFSRVPALTRWHPTSSPCPVRRTPTSLRQSTTMPMR
ncbi:hypothetical protein E1292_17015 [Nonomuraea deserti]|uniref:Uncharacterized protein n=1 Tax=Nonomuraea deserti TaxID=1848322 RepID=A0A4R4VK54_9ACTN|nr:hypothetical protein [Nonomuraea deserti]TDD05371.1 hypothetical protein E1292_17015 [Nonomuraea deserti]